MRFIEGSPRNLDSFLSENPRKHLQDWPRPNQAQIRSLTHLDEGSSRRLNRANRRRRRGNRKFSPIIPGLKVTGQELSTSGIASAEDVKNRIYEQAKRYVQLLNEGILTPPWRKFGTRHPDIISKVIDKR